MKHRIIYTLLTVIVLLIAVIAACNIIVNANARGRTYDIADSVPPRNTALLLGTNPKSRYSKGPNLFYWARIHSTIDLYRKGKFRKLIISGAKSPGYDEPTTMKSDLVRMGLPADIMTLDDDGHRTLLSMKNVRDHFHADSMIIISQKWHNERSVFLADRMGMHVVGYNAGDINNPIAQITHVRELLARVKLFMDIYVTHRKDFSQTVKPTKFLLQPLQQRFALPEGYTRVRIDKGSFADFLRHLPLKASGADLHLYNGTVKEEKYDGGVVDVDFGHRYAEQCADALIYLRAVWLWKTRQYHKIHFNFDNGFCADYIRWAKGERIHINQRNWHCSWSKDAREDYSYTTFRRYLDLVFVYAGTASLEKELVPVEIKDLHAGDVLINGGHPGHAVIIVDEAANHHGHRIYLIAQGYTPAQEIEIFNNWFTIDPHSDSFETPGWTFIRPYSKRFSE